MTSRTVSITEPLRVRIGSGYDLRYNILHGQRNARFIQRRFLPAEKLLSWADAIALVPESGFDVIHTFNAVPLLTTRPYVIVFEDYMPRVPEDRPAAWLENWLRQRICAGQCVGLIAMSEYGRRQCLWQNRSFRGLAALCEKLQVIYPAPPVRRESPKKISNTLKLVFAGNDFMRKGAPALLRAHRRLREAGIPVRTTVVSGLRWSRNDYIGPPSEEYVAEQRRLFAQEGVEVLPFMAYDRLVRLFEESDYMVIPTLHDTFGFASLDALSCATPVIATATCAQPEIIEDGECGYLLPFENDEHVGKWTWVYRNRDPGYVEAYDQTVRSLGEALARRLLTCWEERSGYEALSAGALSRMRSRFGVETARDRIESLYERCRSRNLPGPA